jgi:hypothetical protein
MIAALRTQKEQMNIRIFTTRQNLGTEAASAVAAELRSRVRKQP